MTVTNERELRDAIADRPGSVLVLDIARTIECSAPVTINDRRSVKIRGDGSIVVGDISGLPGNAWALCIERCGAVSMSVTVNAHFGLAGPIMRKANGLRIDGCGYVRLSATVYASSDEPLYPTDGAIQLCEIMHCTGAVYVSRVYAQSGGSTVRCVQLTDNDCPADVELVEVVDENPWRGIGFDSKAMSVVGVNRGVLVRGVELINPSPKSAWWCRVNGYPDPESPPGEARYRRPRDVTFVETHGVGLEALYADSVRVGRSVELCKYAECTDFRSECPRTYERTIGNWSEPIPEG